jgi:hypothetical protein
LAAAATVASAAADPGAQAPRDRFTPQLEEEQPAPAALRAAEPAGREPAWAEHPAHARPVETESMDREPRLVESEEASASTAEPIAPVEGQSAEPATYRAPALAQAYAMPADMVQVETTHAATVSDDATAHADTQPRRPRRPRASESASESEPLVQIETRSQPD